MFNLLLQFTNKIFKNFFEGVTILTTAINLALLADYYIISHDLSSLHTVLKLILFIYIPGYSGKRYYEYLVKNIKIPFDKQNQLMLYCFYESIGKVIEIFTTSVGFTIALAHFKANPQSFTKDYLLIFSIGTVLYILGGYLIDNAEDKINELQRMIKIDHYSKNI